MRNKMACSNYKRGWKITCERDEGGPVRKGWRVCQGADADECKGDQRNRKTTQEATAKIQLEVGKS